MKNAMLKLIASLMVLGAFASCTVVTTGPYYNCYPVYDYWGYYLYDDCYWEYYNQDGSVSKELDLSAAVADVEALKLEKTAQRFADKFNLSADQGMKLAKNIADFNALQDRSEADVADFAQKLYGVNPSEAISAISNAQVGNNAELDSLVEKAAGNFGTDRSNMKAIIKEIHSEALKQNGISL